MAIYPLKTLTLSRQPSSSGERCSRLIQPSPSSPISTLNLRSPSGARCTRAPARTPRKSANARGMQEFGCIVSPFSPRYLTFFSPHFTSPSACHPSIASVRGLAVSRRSGGGTARQEAEGKRGLPVGGWGRMCQGFARVFFSINQRVIFKLSKGDLDDSVPVLDSSEAGATPPPMMRTTTPPKRTHELLFRGGVGLLNRLDYATGTLSRRASPLVSTSPQSSPGRPAARAARVSLSVPSILKMCLHPELSPR